MPDAPNNKLLIRGITKSGSVFRPSDWADRMAGILSTFDLNSRISYSPYVRPTTFDGVKCILVDHKLEELDSRAWHFLVGFAHDNELVMEERD